MCDTLVTLTDEGIMFAKNSDRDVNEAQYLDWIPAMDHAAGSALRCTWIDVPQVEHTRAVLLSRPWWIWGAEMGANDAGVVVGNEAVFTSSSVRRGRKHERALLGMDLLRLGLERAATAHEAVGVMVDMLERYGQGGPHSHDHTNFTYDNSFLVTDGRTAIVLETAGRQWATEEVPAGTTRSISNLLTIEPFAAQHGDRLRTRIGNGRIRCSRTSGVASGATGVADIAHALRSHDGDTRLEYSPISGAMTSPCMHVGGLVTSSQTVSSWISDLRHGVQHWTTATAAPCLSVFKPVQVDEAVDLGPVPDRSYDESTLWWRHERFHRLAARDVLTTVRQIAQERDRIEDAWFTTPPTSADAFRDAEVTEERWLRGLLSAVPVDTRPWWVRQFWRRANRAAGLDGVDMGSMDKTPIGNVAAPLG